MPETTPFSILVPSNIHGAIEERFAAALSRLRLATGEPAVVVPYRSVETARDVSARIATGIVVVLTDDTLLAPAGIASKLVALLARSGASAVVPTASDSAETAQRAATDEPYLVLGQFEAQAARVEASGRPELERIMWGSADPGLFAARTEILRDADCALPLVLTGLDVAVARRLFVHRFASMRGQSREDLFARVPDSACAVLEFGCGEGVLAAALKARQPCRVVGVELDEDAARVAATCADRVLSGDVRELLSSIGETFDFAIGGDIVEHLDDPWEFLRRLRGVVRPGGRLLLSLPNVACWPVARELLAGRFDYVYLGVTCVGHLRFFTRRSIEEMLAISGWTPVSIEPQPEFRTSEYEAFVEHLRASGIPISEAELLTPGYYVTAENPG